MKAHIRERVLLLASDERAILCRNHPEQGRVTDATGALSETAAPMAPGGTRRAGLREVGGRGWRCCSEELAGRTWS